MEERAQRSEQAAEQARLTALINMAILDTAAEPEFDGITLAAAAALGAASAAISLVDADRQWFKARHNIPVPETPRDQAFCAHALALTTPLVVPDARCDPRFIDNPLVTAPGGIRFYAGAPLIAGGACLGTLCVFDPAPRPGLTAAQSAVLTGLAATAARLIEARRFWRAGQIATQVVDVTSDAILCTDRAGVIRFWNRAAEQVFGYAAAEVLGRDLDCIIPPAMVDAHHRGFERVRGGAESALAGRSIALPARRKDGTEFPIELSIARWGEPEGIGGFAAIVRDISARRELERERQQASDFLDTIVANLPAMLFVKDAESRRYLLVNAAGERLTGRSAAEMIGETDAALFPESGPAAEARDEEALRAALPRTDESCFVRADGGRVHIRTRRIVIDGPERPRQFILGLSEDISEARRAEAEVHRLAHFDTLTGLINRDSFLAELERRVADAIPFAFLSIDLDRFKAVNEQFGHATGDEVLVILGERLRAAVRADDITARTGGDEFAVLLLGPDAEARARSVAQRLVERFAEPIATSRAIAHSGATIGIALAPQDGATPNAVRQSVELARERAKADGRGQFRFFSPEQDASARARRALEADLRLAIERGEIALAYQPIVATATGQITSVEALARWSHPVHGPIPPDLFVSLAEESGLIHALGALVLRRACADATNFAVDVRVAVNLSPLQFQGGALCEQVRAILAETGLDPHRLQLEVTEGLVIRDVEATFHELNRLRAQGIHIHLDDFGVGYSSLGYFQRFRFDTVKIDKSFVDTIATSASARAIIGAVVGLGGALGMKVVAEGVEEAAQMELLVALGCTHLQGYLFSRPVSAEAVRALLAQPAAPLRAAL